MIDIKQTVIEIGGFDRAHDRACGEGRSASGRVRYIHPDCGFWMLKRNIADGKIRALVEGRNRYEGRVSRA